ISYRSFIVPPFSNVLLPVSLQGGCSALGWVNSIPSLVGHFQSVTNSAGHYKTMSVWRIDNDASHAGTAIWWLNNNPGVWRQWVTDEAATAIQEALDGGERAKGWPDQ
ncbi:MAG: hypothetical protein OXE02_06835, partial [Chloroflexi bacterium]|nr:hypothetical protein [Chloroflexota bacterium]